MVRYSLAPAYDKLILCNILIVHNLLVIPFLQVRWNIENSDEEKARIWKIENRLGHSSRTESDQRGFLLSGRVR